MRTVFAVAGTCLLMAAPAIFGADAPPPSPLPAAAPRAWLYVAPDGDDSGPGTEARPLATLERARDAIRALKKVSTIPPGGAIVCVRPGTYPLKAALQLAAEESGSQGAPVEYVARPGEDARSGKEVRLTGGREVTGFAPVTDAAVLDRLDAAARGKVLQADLRKLGITDFGEMKVRGFGRPVVPAGLELFFQDKPMPLARWPNSGWAKIAGAPAGANGGRFTYEGDRPRRWSKAEDLWLHGYWTQDWADSYVKVRSINAEAREIGTVEPHGVYGYKAGQRFRALNMLEELDEPGEWYLDRKAGVLYFWPPAPFAESKVYVSIIDSLISLKNVSQVTFRGFTLECSRGTAVRVEGGSDVVIGGCTIRNVGNHGVVMAGGTRNSVVGCDIYEVGDAGVVVSGGDRATLKAAGHVVRNNHIHHFSRWDRTYRPAVELSGVGSTVAHNLIHDAPHCGILFGGNEHCLELNEVHDVCRETGDVGAFYIGRDWTMRGNIIRYNYFHDIHGPVGYGANAVYLDDAASGTTILGNVFYRASRAAFIGGGRDNVVENNVFVDCEPAVHIDARGLGWAKSHISPGGDWQMYRKLEAVRYDQPPYSTRYPKLATILKEEPARPLGNVVWRNISVGGRWLDLEQVDKAWVVFEDNLTQGDAGFVDAAGRNFQLRADSPAWKLGFRRIPIDEIGLEKDGYRAVLAK